MASSDVDCYVPVKGSKLRGGWVCQCPYLYPLAPSKGRLPSGPWNYSVHMEDQVWWAGAWGSLTGETRLSAGWSPEELSGPGTGVSA